MSDTIENVLNFDDADLAANRLGQLTQKQKDLLAEKAKSHKSLSKGIGIFIAIVFGGSLLSGFAMPIFSLISGSVLSGEEFTPAILLSVLPFLCMGLIFLVVFGGILLLVLRVVFERANRKVDTVVRRAEGKVNFVWVERQERNLSSAGPMYKTVRVLEMRIGGETFNVKQELPNVINQGEEWIFYYTNHPFKFLSAEKID